MLLLINQKKLWADVAEEEEEAERRGGVRLHRSSSFIKLGKATNGTQPHARKAVCIQF